MPERTSATIEPFFRLPSIEKQAADIVKQIRDPQNGGMGILQGKFNPRIIDYSEISHYFHYTNVRGFIKDKEIRNESTNDSLDHFLGEFHSESAEWMRGKPPFSYLWVVKKHQPKMEDIIEPREVIKGKLIKRRKIENFVVGISSKTFEGMHGNEDWTDYELHMKITHYSDSRPGTVAKLKFAVPPDTAESINAAVEESPLFPEALFRHMYPGFVGQDPMESLTRKPADRLSILDFRKKWQGESRVVPFDKTIPF